MFGMSRGRAPGAQAGDLATVAAVGGDGYSGMVPAGAPIRTDPDQGGRHDDTGRHVVETHPQPTSDLAPIPGVVTRPMLGGLRTAHHERLLVEPPAYTGAHVELRNRRSVVVLAPIEQQLPDATPVLPSLRVPPPSDPYGRVCINAQAVRNAQQAGAGQ